MKISTKLRLNAFISLGVLTVILLSFAWSFRELSRSTSDIDLLEEMRVVAFERTALRDDYLLYREARAKNQWNSKTETLNRLFQIASKQLTTKEETTLLAEARKDFDATVSSFSQFMSKDRAQWRVAKKGLDINEADSQLIGQVFLRAYALSDGISRLHELELVKRTTAQNRGFFAIIITIIGGVIAIIINSIFTSRVLSRRVAALGKAVEIIGAGNLDYNIATDGNDELSGLATASNAMAAKLKQSHTSVEHLEKEIERRKRTEELIQVRMMLFEYATSHTLEELLRKTLDEVGRLVDSPIGFYHFVEPDEKTLSLQAWSTLTLERFCKAEGKGFHYSVDKAGVWVDCVRQRKPVIHNDYASLPDRKGLPEGHAAVNRELVVPILRDKRIVAILGVGNKPHEYTEQDVNKVTYLADVAWEIVERKRAEEALLKSGEQFRNLADTIPNLAWWASGDGYITWYNRRWYEYTGTTPEQMEGWGWQSVHDPKMLPNVLERWKMSIATGEPFDMEFPLLGADGIFRTFLTRVLPLKDSDGKVLRWFGTNTDISALKQAEERLMSVLADLERSNKELEQFAYVASHDLQEPLRMISSYTQLLAQRYEGQLDEKAHKYINYAVDGAVRMQGLINDLLAYSRVNTRGGNFGPVDSHSALGAALRNLSVAIEENRAIVISDDLPIVSADATQLSQVFQNLISNAIKFQGAELPRIHVSARDLGREWMFSVQDNGIGIDAKYADKVFVIFQRLHTRQEYPGTGIGLAICKRIVERHGGRIWYESEPGKGATFYFTLQK
jgi:PAS domain S-box-containing protein